MWRNAKQRQEGTRIEREKKKLIRNSESLNFCVGGYFCRNLSCSRLLPRHLWSKSEVHGCRAMWRSLLAAQRKEMKNELEAHERQNKRIATCKVGESKPNELRLECQIEWIGKVLGLKLARGECVSYVWKWSSGGLEMKIDDFNAD